MLVYSLREDTWTWRSPDVSTDAPVGISKIIYQNSIYTRVADPDTNILSGSAQFGHIQQNKFLAIWNKN